jgi:large subunit ribosomal protein L15
MMADTTKEKVTLGNLKPAKGSTQSRKRLGRGLGKTAGKGHKGQKARSGGHVRPGFEGGQMPLIRRVPKRGFTNPFKEHFQVVNLKSLEQFAGAEVTAAQLAGAGLVQHELKPIKVLGDGDAPKGLVLKGVAVSAPAKAKIEAAGGRVEA